MNEIEIVSLTEKKWIKAKNLELAKWIGHSASFGEPDIMTWDLFKFMVIVNKQAREIRRLKTELGKK